MGGQDWSELLTADPTALRWAATLVPLFAQLVLTVGAAVVLCLGVVAWALVAIHSGDDDGGHGD